MLFNYVSCSTSSHHFVAFAVINYRVECEQSLLVVQVVLRRPKSVDVDLIRALASQWKHELAVGMAEGKLVVVSHTRRGGGMASRRTGRDSRR